MLTVLGLVAVARSTFGSDASTAAGVTNPTSTAVDGSTTIPGAPDDGTASAILPVGSSVTTLASVAPRAPHTPTSADPAKVLLVGDSEAGGLSPYLQKALAATGVVSMTTDYKVSTGLVRPDFFDWPAHLQQTIPLADPAIVVALFGGNDGQSFLGKDPNAGAAAGKSVDSPEWRAEYAKRIGALMDFLSAGGRTLVWVGVPNALKADLTARLAVQNEVVQSEVAKRPKVIFVDSWRHFIGIDGVSFAPYVLDPRDGGYKPVRNQTDGFHLNTDGESILAVYVSDAVDTDLRARGASI
jgi:hypothetical protein